MIVDHTATQVLQDNFQEMYDTSETLRSVLYEDDQINNVKAVNSLSVVIYQCNKLMQDWINCWAK